jgi:hypothetical protein
VMAAKRYVEEGRRFVVDVDLEKFFDRVNHDVLMGRRVERIPDRRVLGADPSLPRSRRAGERGGYGTGRGDTGEAGSRLRPVRRRLRRVRAQSARRATHDGAAAAALPAAPAASQPQASSSTSTSGSVTSYAPSS